MKKKDLIKSKRIKDFANAVYKLNNYSIYFPYITLFFTYPINRGKDKLCEQFIFQELNSLPTTTQFFTNIGKNPTFQDLIEANNFDDNEEDVPPADQDPICDRTVFIKSDWKHPKDYLKKNVNPTPNTDDEFEQKDAWECLRKRK